MREQIEAGDLVVVFGGSGFLGSHTADALSEAGFRVRIFDVHPSPYLRPGQEMVIGDIENAADVFGAVEGARVIYNLAAIADIATANQNPPLAARINVLGTINTLEAARCLGVARYVFSSTIYVYSAHGGFYRASKQAAERFIETYQQIHGLPFTILRYGTLYGRRAGKTNRIYSMISQALCTGVIDYPGSGNAVRDFIHVLDAAALSVRILDAAYANRHLIITGQEKLRVVDVARMIQEMMPTAIDLRFRDGEPEGHYELTPYSFNPALGHKLVPDDYVDLGQGLLDCLSEQYEKLSQIIEVPVARPLPARTLGKAADRAAPSLDAVT